MPARRRRDPAVKHPTFRETESIKCILQKYIEHGGWEGKGVLSGTDNAEDFFIRNVTLVKLSEWTNRCALISTLRSLPFPFRVSKLSPELCVIICECGAIR